MKRIAALAALVITMLAVPAAAALASTGGSGPGYGRPGPVQIACQLPAGFRKGPVKIQAYVKAYQVRHRHGKPVPVHVICPFIPAKPLPKGCEPSKLVFDMAAGSSTLTEVSGPVLSPTQEFSYDGSTYTIMSVNPGADSFTVFKDGWLFVNQGATITDGAAVMGCSA